MLSSWFMTCYLLILPTLPGSTWAELVPLGLAQVLAYSLIEVWFGPWLQFQLSPTVHLPEKPIAASCYCRTAVAAILASAAVTSRFLPWQDLLNQCVTA